MELKYCINEFLDKLVARYGPKLELVLGYGSYFEGKFKAGSDLDIIIVIKDKEPKILIEDIINFVRIWEKIVICIYLQILYIYQICY